MLLRLARRPAIRTLRGWAISVLQDTGAIRECAEHGWLVDRGDPHARERALFLARSSPPAGVITNDAVAAVKDVLDGLCDTCPECESD